MPVDADTQHENFLAAVDALGGVRAAARAIGISERSMSRLVARRAALHDGFLRDTATALLERAQLCRDLERRLSPMFAENLLPDQPRENGRRWWRQEAG